MIRAKVASSVDTAVWVALIAVIGPLVGSTIERWRARRRDNAETDSLTAATAQTQVATSLDLVESINARLKAQDEKLAEQDDKIADLKKSLRAIRDELAAERAERAAAERLASEIDAELHAANRYIEVLTSTLTHHGLEVPLRPPLQGDTP